MSINTAVLLTMMAIELGFIFIYTDTRDNQVNKNALALHSTIQVSMRNWKFAITTYNGKQTNEWWLFKMNPLSPVLFCFVWNQVEKSMMKQ